MLSGSQPCVDVVSESRTPHEVADIFRRFGDSYRTQYPVSPEQSVVMRDIVQCRTAVLGGHVDACDGCGTLRISYNSCRNRHCPKCGALARAEWIEQQKALLLPTHYFHLVFTIDHNFNPIARVNQKAVYDALFKAAAETLKAFGHRYLGGETGFTAMLHTWGQQLTQHIHLHCLMPGGALTADGRRWQAAAADYLFPVVALSAAFRERFCRILAHLFETNRLQFVGQAAVYGDADRFRQLLTQAREKAWQVYIKPPFGEAAQVVDYLGHYFNRAAFSNQRLLAISGEQVRFSYRDYRAAGALKEMTISGVEFMRRFLLHVLPKRFVRVRHYGLLAPRVRARKLAQCRRQLGALSADATTPATREAVLEALLGHPPQLCPFCESGRWLLYETLQPHPSRQRWWEAIYC